MRTTLIRNGNLLTAARKLTGITDSRALIHEALKALIERESARRLARLGGSGPQLRRIPRRRSAAAPAR